MESAGNIVIGDTSAEFFLLHDDAARRIVGSEAWANPLDECATDPKNLRAFNTGHPLYGGRPVTLLVPQQSLRRENADIACRAASGAFPAQSFFQLRDGLYMATPECVFLRAAASGQPLGHLVELATNLCGRYYLRVVDGKDEITRRSGFLTTLDRLAQYLDEAAGLRGCRQAKRALKFAACNSGSPEETRLWVILTLPVRYGGFGLPFTHMNYNVKLGRLSGLLEQSKYELDIIAYGTGFSVEYDGEESHLDASKDKRRRNDLKVLDWDVYPVDKFTLYNASRTEQMGRQIAKLLGKRLRLDAEWRGRYIDLRRSLGLPV